MSDTVGLPMGEPGQATIVFWGKKLDDGRQIMSHQTIVPNLMDGTGWEVMKADSQRALAYLESKDD